MHQPYPYTGKEKLLVIGIDVGTTLSGVSYALLEPGKVPRIQPVTRFFGQREENGKSKVRSVVFYDQDGNVIAAGPEADPEVNASEIEDIRQAECFKLHLWPNRLATDKRPQLEKFWSPPELANDEGETDFPSGVERVGGGKVEGRKKGSRGERDTSKEEDLLSTPSRNFVERQPLNKRLRVPRPVTDDFKTPDRVFTDFFQYLFKSAKEYITETERFLDPTFTWSAIERNTYFVLTHPNRWEGRQQSQMRDAAVAAGLVNNSTSAHRITFVTEGEAGLHFCLYKNPELRQERGGLLVVDCGGGTVDLSAYLQTGKGCFKEIVSPDCLLQGSILVTSRARDYFQEKFKDSKFGSDDTIETMARSFDKPEGVKCIFRHPNRPYFVNFGGLRDSDPKYGICGGKFKVEGAQMARFFEPAIQDIISGIENQCRNTKDGVSIKHVLLIGGFGRSQYLYQKLSDYFDSSGIAILRPDITHQNKAVADGAVSWYLDRYVSTHYHGVMTRHSLDPTEPDHLKRESAAWTTANTAGNRGQAACVKQAFTLRRTKPSPQQVHACNSGQKLPSAANRRREKPATADSSSQARRRRQEWRDAVEIGTGSQDSDCRSRNGHIEQLKAEEARLNYCRGHSSEESTRSGDGKPGDGDRTTRGKDRHTNVKGEQLHKLSSSIGNSDRSSVVEVAELVRMLNAQIEQVSNLKTDSLSYRESPISSKELEDVLNGLTGYIESTLCNYFRSKLNNLNIAPDPLITQIVLQSGLAKACSYIANNGIPSSDGAIPPRTHGDMVAAQADTDTWKALARS
ncbi:hypothetical protein JOM56_015084 [Amanita muscaria]